MNYSIPDQELSVDGSGNITIANALTMGGSIFTNNNNFVLSSNVAGNITIQSSGGEILIDSSAFQAQTGSWQLQPSGDLYLVGQLQVGGGAVLISNVGVITAPQFSVSATGNIQATGKLSVGANNFNVDAAGNLVTDGSTHFVVDTSGNLRIAGDFSLFSGNFAAHENGNVTVGGILSVGNLSVNTSGNLQTFGTIAAGGSLQFTVDATGSIAAPAIKITTTPNAGYVLTSDASGNGTWQAAPGATPAGANTQIQFNSTGNFGASADLTFNTALDTLNIIGTSSQPYVTLHRDASPSGAFAQFTFNNIANNINYGGLQAIGNGTDADISLSANLSNVFIDTQNGHWVFDPNGGLTTNAGTSALRWDPSVGILRLDATTGNDTSALLLRSNYTQCGSVEFTNLSDVNFEEIDGYSDGHLEITTGTGTFTWNFGADGSLTGPNSHFVYAYPSDIQLNQDGGSTITWSKSDTTTVIADIYANETEGFVVQTQPLNSTWTFGLDGSLTLPNLAVQPGTPVKGKIIYNSTLNKLQFYNGTAWETVTSA